MAQWFYQKDGRQNGPVETPALKQMALDGQLLPADLIWRDGLPQWVAASEVKGLFPAPSVENDVAGEPPLLLRDEAEPQSRPAGQLYACTGCGGLFPLDGVYDDNGRIICKRCHVQQAARQSTGMGGPLGYGGPIVGYAPARPSTGTGMIVSGYICAGVALVFCPIGFGIAAIVIGIKNCNGGRPGHGTAQIAIAIVTTIVGVIFGAYVMSHR